MSELRRRIAVLFLFASPLLFPLAAHAFAVSPVLLEERLDPGGRAQEVLHLTNDSNGEQTYYATVQNFVPYGEEGQQRFMPETDTSGLVSWVALDQPSVTLKAGESRDFAFAISLPKDAEPGGHYAAVFFSTIPPSEQGATAVGVGAKTGVLLLVTVNGDIHEQATVESFSVMSAADPEHETPVSEIDHLPALFETRIQNEGSVHFALGGKVVIKNMFGSTVGEVSANPQGSRVLPNSIRRVRTEWGNSYAKSGGFFDQLAAEWSGFGIGKYTATLEGTYGSAHAPLNATVSFWIFPWRLFLLILAAFILLLLLIKGYNAMVIKGAVSKAKKKEESKK